MHEYNGKCKERSIPVVQVLHLEKTIVQLENICINCIPPFEKEQDPSLLLD